MIHLGAALLCDAATVRENVLHVLGGGVTRLPRPGFPAALSADVALTLYLDGEPGAEISHTVSGACRKRGSDEAPIFGFNYTLRTVLGPDDGAQSVSAVLPLGDVGVPEAGAYEIAISVDGELLGKIPFSAILDESLASEWEQRPL